MASYSVETVAFGTNRYNQTLLLRDRVMRKPLGLSIQNDDLSFEKHATILAVFDTDTLLGMGVLDFIDETTASICFLCVDTSLQKGGIGRAIVEDMEKRALQHGVKKICLEARITAKDFYDKLGYQEYGDIYLLKKAPIEHIKMEKML